MKTKKLKTIISTLVLLLVVSSALVASAVAKETNGTTPVSSGHINWCFSSRGSGNQITSFGWDEVTPSSGVTVPSKVAKRSETSPNTWVIGTLTADYWGDRVFTSKSIVRHIITNNVINGYKY